MAKDNNTYIQIILDDENELDKAIIKRKEERYSHIGWKQLFKELMQRDMETAKDGIK